MSKKIVFGNFKGGTGKTSNACIISYCLSEMGYKTLLIDLDQQANATSLMFLTKVNNEKMVKPYTGSLMSGILEGDLQHLIVPIKENLYALPTYSDIASFPIYLENKYRNRLERISEMKKLIAPFEDKFDFILIDTPPTISVYTDNAIMMADTVIITLQTQSRSMQGCQKYIQYLREINENYKKDFSILGILPVMFKKSSATEQRIIGEAITTFGTNNMFRNVVPNLERIKTWDTTGITKKEEMDMHDRKVMDIYFEVTTEMLERLGVNNG